MTKTKKRKVDLVVISDVHLGTYGCRAQELLNYLKSISPKTIILNGDIIDIWQFKKSYFPKSHLKVVKYLMTMLTNGTKMYYVTGNHDEMLRRFVGFRVGSFEIVNKVVLDLDGKKGWFFHGDVFDISMKHSKWVAKLGGKGYDFLIRINAAVNWCLEKMGYERISFSKRVKNAVKGAVKHINNFETTAADIAIMNGYEYVVCGHIHTPVIKTISNKQNKKVQYLNSGDWIENLTSLEFHKGEWKLYHYHESVPDLEAIDQDITEATVDTVEYDSVVLMEEILMEFKMTPASQFN